MPPPDRAALDWAWAADLPEWPDPEEQLVEGVIGRLALSVLYGDSNSGKTFLAVDIGCALAQRSKWMGRHTLGGLVVYLATESPQSVRTRLQAYQRHYGRKVPNFAIVQSPINLFDSGADAQAVVTLIRELESEVGEKCELVIGDTLSRMAAGANENSGEDMGTVIKHAEQIKRDAQVHVLLIHHSGKDQARGARGWSGLRAAIDTEIEVTADEATGMRVAEITKQRDIPGKGSRFGFRLEVVDLGPGQWDTRRSSCVVVPADAPAKVAKGKRPSEVAGAIVEALRARGTGMKRGDLAKHLDQYQRQSVYREINKLLDAHRLIETAGVVALNKSAQEVSF
ncbi:AAA family ATPase [Ramlibacter sp. AW1]|uniref:AAA family ATPase n=1 Tax=Ramlibacter aurantiacus TaxID=2801330 RepID=A0A936ZIK9_9BURK|nr:AAA family ATPase [Ramlibacter aurantiacus]MBL0420512.1 AAA family ATPase [Ramlibacter aurantiacus]